MTNRVSDAPFVSVVMPVRGIAPFIKLALDSIGNQSGIEFEIICIDDGVAESTLEQIKEFSVRSGRLRLVVNHGDGIVDALNTGLSYAKGQFVARMDSDDIALAGRLAAQAAFLGAFPEIGVLGTQATLIDANGAPLRILHVPIGADRVDAALQISCALIHPTVMMRLDVVREAGGYRHGFDGAEDYELWLRLRWRTKLDNLAQPFLLYRRHEGQVTLRRQFHQARLAALAVVGNRLRQSHGVDVTAALDEPKKWRAFLAKISASSVDDVRNLTACSLADNGGTLRASGARYLRLACRIAVVRGSPEVRDRLALACVRHQVHLWRSGRWSEALRAVAFDLVRWRTKMLSAYYQHASTVWRSK